jgi:hypothetical protein
VDPDSDLDSDPNPAIFGIDLQANKKIILKDKFFFLKVNLHNFSKIKSLKGVKTVGIMVFLTIFA